MTINYYSIEKAVVDEIEIKKSRFITYLYPIQTEEDFDEHLAAIKKEHYRATHHCQAFILNADASVQRMSDDGEPSGTAGLPMLEVLKQNELTYIMAVVVRYFGSTKLGAGGLIRAYSSAVADALKQAQYIKNVTQRRVKLTLAYDQIDPFNHYLSQTEYQIDVLDTLYETEVTYDLSIIIDEVEQVKAAFMEVFSGQFGWELGEEETINLPVSNPHAS